MTFQLTSQILCDLLRIERLSREHGEVSPNDSKEDRLALEKLIKAKLEAMNE